METKVTTEHYEVAEGRPRADSGELEKVSSGQNAPYIIDPLDEKRLVRKLDWMIVMPFICITYLLTYCDKAFLGYSAVFGLKESLGLHGEQYSWLGSIFYFGYLVFEYPTSYAMQKLSVSKWLAANIFIWGGLTAALGGCTRFGPFLALRFLLGAFESCSTPAFLLLTAAWYRVEEQPIRIGWWSTFLGIANAFGGLVAFAIGHINGKLESWQYQFILIGVISSAWGAFMFFAMPSSPASARLLTPLEREIAVERLKQEQFGVKNTKIKKDQLKEVFLDPKTYVIFLLGIATQIVNGAVSNFGSLIVKGFGFSSLRTLLYQIPYGMIILVSNVSAMYIQRWLPGHRRCIVAVVYVLPALAGVVGIHTIAREHRAALLGCYWLTATYTASFSMIMSLITSNTAGTTKRYAINAIFFISYCVGNIVGPFAFKQSESPTYTSGIVTILIAYCVEIVLLLGFGAYMAYLNKRKNEKLAAMGLSLETVQQQRADAATKDLTDIQSPYFQYSY